MNALLLLLALTSTLVLRSGDRIAVDGTPREENGVVTFRSGGVLYSMPSSEVLRIDGAPEEKGKGKPVRRLRGTAEERKRILEQLEKNHAGSPAPPQPILATPPPPPTPAQAAETKREESYWRSQARSHRESVRRALEDVQLLESRVEELRSQIHGFLALGYKPGQFTYQTTQLVRTEEQLPAARLEVTRAERAYEEFREEARREGVVPGWLR